MCCNTREYEGMLVILNDLLYNGFMQKCTLCIHLCIHVCSNGLKLQCYMRKEDTMIRLQLSTFAQRTGNYRQSFAYLTWIAIMGYIFKQMNRQISKQTNKYTHTHTYIHTHILCLCMCMCICVFVHASINKCNDSEHSLS